jgi:hypothetical protein
VNIAGTTQTLSADSRAVGRSNTFLFTGKCSQAARIAEVYQCLGFRKTKMLGVDEGAALRHIARADLNQPVIFITVWSDENQREEHILIDGWHRFRKMVQLGRTEPLQAYVFSLEDSKLLELKEDET